MRHICHITTIVALHTVRCAVHREGHIAMGTTHRPATTATLHKGGEASAILKQHNLLLSLQSITHRIEQLNIKMALALTSLDRTHSIREYYSRLLRLAISLHQA